MLTPGIIPTLKVTGLSRLFIDGPVFIRWNDALIGLQKITVASGFFINFRDSTPQIKASRLTSIPHGESDHLADLTTQGNPNPNLVDFTENKLLSTHKQRRN